MDEQEKEYSVAEEIGIVFGLGLSTGVIILVVGIARVEFLK